MNLIILFHNDYLEKDLVCLKDHRLVHIRQVHRAQVGERVRVGILNGKMGIGVVESLSEEKVLLRITLDSSAPPPSPVTLVMALPRPKMLKRCLRMVAEVGVKELYLINSMRVEKSFWQSPWLSEEKIDECLLLGLEQAKDTLMPKVYIRRGFKPFVEDQLPGLLEGKLGLIAHPNTESLQAAGISTPITQPALLCIGPEGGFIPYEVGKLIQAGCQPVDLGERIYRVETALPLLMGRLFL